MKSNAFFLICLLFLCSCKTPVPPAVNNDIVTINVKCVNEKATHQMIWALLHSFESKSTVIREAGNSEYIQALYSAGLFRDIKALERNLRRMPGVLEVRVEKYYAADQQNASGK